MIIILNFPSQALHSLIKHTLRLLSLLEEGPPERALHLDQILKHPLCVLVRLHKVELLLVLTLDQAEALDIVEDEAGQVLVLRLQKVGTLSVKFQICDCSLKYF